MGQQRMSSAFLLLCTARTDFSGNINPGPRTSFVVGLRSGSMWRYSNAPSPDPLWLPLAGSALVAGSRQQLIWNQGPTQRFLHSSTRRLDPSWLP
ncbi:hypothetical protein B0H19DRAFT_1155945 [Mycena capillaripes]|nr:hypothetical protein B0H19DRAFT_1155945 [Mycena capillaripes]